MFWRLLALLAGATPPMVTSGELEPQGQVRAEASLAWERYEAMFFRISRVHARSMAGPIAVRKGELPGGHGGASRPGEVWLRQARPFVLSDREVVALRHELAHQFLFAACPQASEDRLFHEAFALGVSGELAAWTENEYGGLSWAVKELSRQGAAIDSKDGRRALARLLVEGLTADSELPHALVVPLKRCADGTRWEPLQPQSIAVVHGDIGVDATVILHRVSGEVLSSQGDVEAPLPYGSTLKPFVVAGATGTPPTLPRRGTAEWMCGEGLPPTLAVGKALSRSCNGYFLDWAARMPEVASLGAWGPVVAQAGLGRAPTDMAEAIGLRSTLSISPLGLARAYRVLAAARPDVLAMMRDNPRDGTLSGLEVSPRLEGLALKTGTVRDAESHPRYGWIVAVSDTLVVVMVKSGRMPRAFAQELGQTVERASRLGGQGTAKVQVFGLLDPALVEARCGGAAFVLVGNGAETTPQSVPASGFGLQHEAARGRLLCLLGPFRVKFPGVRMAEGRDYAGVFTYSPPPPLRGSEGAPLPEKTRRARQGSAFIFETSRALYAAGVVSAEDSLIEGAARAALLKVVDANGQNSRHVGRPVCDTTHCQVFLGTIAPRPGDRAVLARPLEVTEWLLFSRGGEEPWREERPLETVERVLQGPFSALEVRDGQVFVRRLRERDEAWWEEGASSGCEALRGPLKLPSCPTGVRREGSAVVFEGRGRGHGLGLDVEWAKASGLDTEELLRRAYPTSLPSSSKGGAF